MEEEDEFSFKHTVSVIPECVGLESRGRYLCWK